MANLRSEYDLILVEAARRVLLELARLLNEYSDGMVVVGGSVPGLIFDEVNEPHIGTLDVDIALDHQSIPDVGYKSIRELLLRRGYVIGEQPFTFFRTIQIEHREIKIEVDFLSGEYGGTGKKHRTQIIQDMQPRKARACDLAFHNPVWVSLDGVLPDGGEDIARIQVASVVPFLMMKAQALNGRLKEKDAYDIYYCLTNFPGGLDRLVQEFLEFPQHPLLGEGLEILAQKFSSPQSAGPVFVVNFLGESDVETRAFIQRDAFERIQYLLSKVQRS